MSGFSSKTQVIVPAGLDVTQPLAEPGGTIRVDAAQPIATRERRALPNVSISLEAEGPAPLPTGEDDLEVRSLLGEGGMGRVYLARQRSLARDVAVKTTKPAGPAAAERALLLEGVVTGQLEHPAIVPVHALGLGRDGRPVMVMKRIEGVEWRALLSDPAHPAWEHWARADAVMAHVEILRRVCEAVDFAHNNGFVHRDIKPENVMLGRYGEVYLVDWGIAVELGSPAPMLAGSPAYMAPEMAGGGTVDARTDVYLLGATLHQVLTGEMPHGGDTLSEVLEAALRSEPKSYPANVPVELADICQRAMRRDPAQRPQSAEELRRELGEYEQRRLSRELTADAQERLASVEALLAGDESARRNAARYTVEARFGFARALEAWEHNQVARAGLQRCLEQLVELSLEWRDPEHAHMWLEQLLEPRPALTAGLGQLEAELELERREQARLRQLARNLDPAVARQPRAIGVAIMLALGVLLSGAALLQMAAGVELKAPQMMIFAVIMSLMLGAISVFFRSTLLATVYNRRLVGMVGVYCLTLVVSRSIGWHLSEPVSEMLLRDMLLFVGVTGVGAVAVQRWIGWLAAMMLGVLGLCFAFPGREPEAFSISTAAAAFVALYFTRKGDGSGKASAES